MSTNNVMPIRPEIGQASRYAATVRIAVTVDLEALMRGLGESGLTMQRDRRTGEFVIVPRQAPSLAGMEGSP